MENQWVTLTFKLIEIGPIRIWNELRGSKLKKRCRRASRKSITQRLQPLNTLVWLVFFPRTFRFQWGRGTFTVLVASYTNEYRDNVNIFFAIAQRMSIRREILIIEDFFWRSVANQRSSKMIREESEQVSVISNHNCEATPRPWHISKLQKKGEIQKLPPGGLNFAPIRVTLITTISSIWLMKIKLRPIYLIKLWSKFSQIFCPNFLQSLGYEFSRESFDFAVFATSIVLNDDAFPWI